MARNILVVEDDNNISNLIKMYLDKEGFEVRLAADGGKAVEEFQAQEPDLVLLDLGLPDQDGSEIIRSVRERSGVPIIVLSARSDEQEKVAALDLGANDYVTKPFGAEELMARIRSELRSRRGGQEVARGCFESGNLTIDYDARRVTVEGNEIRLTQIEYNIIALLAQHCGQMMTYSVIIREIWGGMDAGSVKKLQVNMANIRKKLNERPGENKYFVNELGVGYRMCG